MQKPKATAKKITLTIPTYDEAAYETLPMFAETRNHQGTSGNPFPNAVTSAPCSETAHDVAYDAVMLENKWLQIIVVPALGGRIFAALDKRSGYNFFYRQHVIKPALIGDLGSWISGGVEFNWPFHHRPATYMPADWTVEEGEDGSAAVWVSDIDPFYHMKGAVGICLYPDKAYLETKVRVTNRTELRHPFLWWENAAVSVNENYRLFFPHDVDHVVHHYRSCSVEWPIAKGSYGGCDFGEGTDISLIYNAPHSTSYFAAPSEFDFFGGYDEGRDAGVVHIADHHIAPGKKMFTWGQDQNARDWEKKLTDSDGPYCELMAGTYTDNQPDFTWLQPYETKKFSQFWYPLRKTGCLDYADLDCAVSVRGNHVTVETTRAIPEMRVRVELGDEDICDEAVDCTEPDTFTLMLSKAVSPDDRWRVVITGGGKTISEYSNEKFPKREPRLLHGYPLPDEIKSPYEAWNYGEHLLQYRDPRSDSEVYFRQALKKDPSFVPASLSLAECLINRGLFAQAEEIVRSALKTAETMNQNPESGRAHYLLGLALERQDRFDEAYAAYRKAAWSEDSASKALTRAAALACRRRDWKTAKDLAWQAVEHNCDNYTALAYLTLISFKQKDNDSLKRYFLLASSAKLDQTLRWAAVCAGIADESEFFDMLRRPDQTVIDVACDMTAAGFNTEARRLLDGAINRFPDITAMVYYLDGLTPRRRAVGRTFPHRPEEAAALEEALSSGSRTTRDGYARYLLGVLRFGQRRYDEAEALWIGAHHRAPIRGQALCAWRRGERKKALDLLIKAYDANPYYPPEDETEKNAVVWEAAYLMNTVGEDAAKTVDFILTAAGGDVSSLRDDTALELCRAFCRAKQPEKAMELLRTHHFRPGEGSEAAIAVRYIDAQCGIADKLKASGDVKAAMDAYIAAKTIPDWLDGSIGGEAPFIRAMLGEAECMRELSPNDTSPADKIVAHIAETSPDILQRARLLIKLGRKDEAVPLLGKKLDEWKTEMKKRDSGYYSAQPAYLSYLEPSAADRKRRFGPLIKEAEKIMEEIGQSR